MFMAKSAWRSALAGAAVCGLAILGGPLTPAALAQHAHATTHAKATTRPADAAGPRIGIIELEDTLADREAKVPLMGGKGDVTLREVVEAIDSAAKNSQIEGLFIRLKDAELHAAQVEEIGQAMQRFRAAGKKIHVYAEGYGTEDLLLASYADEVIVQSGGEVSFPGLFTQEMFLADALSWLGMKADYVQVGDYKGADEMLVNAKPSKAWDENINGLLDSLYGQMRAKLKAGRHMDDAQLDKAMEVAWMASDQQAKAAGLVDTILDLPDLDEHLKKEYGHDVAWDDSLIAEGDGVNLDSMNPFAMLSMLSKKPDRTPKRDTIAVLHIDAEIVDGDSGSGGGLLGGGSSVGSRTIRHALKDIEDCDQIKGAIIRIDSPGGSAVASEIIWQGVKRLSAKKPVWVSVGSMAASGGYYIAVSGGKIYVNPSSIVGSIGVVGGKISMEGLYQKLHVNTVARARGPRAAMFGSDAPWTDAEQALVRQKMTETYELFTQRVSAGRKGIDLNTTAAGRLFVGQKAVDMKLADKVGSLEDATKDLASSLSLSEGSYDLMDYPAPKTFEEMLQDLLGNFGISAKAPNVGAMAMAKEIAAVGESLVGKAAWPAVRESLNAMLELRKERVLLVAPSVIVVK